MHRLLVGLLVAVAVGSLVTGTPRPAAAAGSVVPAGFSDDVVISGLDLPTSIEFAPGGRIFVTEKSGLIRMFDSLDDQTPSLVADLRTQVYNNWDRGLLGLAVDPNYPAQPYIYALYSYDALIGGSAPLWGMANTNGDDCPAPPDGPGVTDDGCATSGRLVRLTLDDDGVMTGQKVLINDWCDQYASHSIGTVMFGADGMLYVGGGEGANFELVMDHGQMGGTINNPATGTPYTPVNPCGDPNGQVGTSTTLPNTQGGALRAQSPRRPPTKPTVLNGTIVRVNPDDGNPVSTNPMYTGGRDENERRIVTYGLRNPFRFTIRPGTDELWAGDVGSWYYEEIDRIADVNNVVTNNGWPCYEGSIRNPQWDVLDAASCENLYAAGGGAVNAPYFTYEHEKPTSASDSCATNSGVISGIAFEQGDTYPARYRDALFFADYGRNCIWTMRTGANGLPDPSRVESFVKDAPGPVELQVGPDGQLYYVDMNGGTIHRVTYYGGNQPPIVVATASPTNGPAPLEVSFDASGSSDPDGDPISIAWDLDADGQFDDATGPTATWSYAAGEFSPEVLVSDDHGHSASQPFAINSGNSPPEPVIDTPLDGTTWYVGQNLGFSGHATDDHDGNIPATRLSWRWVMHHCTGPTPVDCHVHVVQDIDGVAQGTFQAPDHEYPSYLELRLTATDSTGLSATVSRDFHPQAVDLTFATNPSGLRLAVAGASDTATFEQTFIVGSHFSLDASAQQTLNGANYSFSSWSDGGARSHTVTAPATAATYTALYTSSLNADAPNKCARATTTSPNNTWLRNTLSSTSDQDWYRFRLAHTRWVRVLLGNIGGNYRIDLYKACGTLLYSSNRTGNEAEEIYVQLAAGTYRVRVSNVSGNAVKPNQEFGLRLIPYPAGVQVLSSTAWTTSAGNLNIDGEVLNNTGNRYRLIIVRATLYDAAGQVLTTRDDWAWVNVLSAHGRSPFRITLPKPAGYDHHTVSVVYSQKTTDAPIAKLAITSSSRGSDGAGIWFRGSFVNGNAFTTRWTTSLTTLYDTWANVLSVDTSWTNPIDVPSATSASYDVRFGEHYQGWNRVLVVLQGSPP